MVIQLPECVNVFVISSNSLRRSKKSFALMRKKKRRKERREEGREEKDGWSDVSPVQGRQM